MSKMAENSAVKRPLNQIPTPVEQGVEHTLGDGSKVVVRKLYGRDIMTAQVICGGSQQGLMLAMTALACSRNGAQVLYEDLLDEDAFVVMELMTLVMEGKIGGFPSPAVEP